ncbi:uncharacterized protein LOC112508565 isoform X2 [Cynara cardunculus var. scolymus]|uniref:uncharacterized protein LOC112508565 isoform X2 n=1 Tax=Cynara cardunculus var. scolymus TaxID=59895 RepID=UPI000D62F86F|nr:uncharacterized protein LOC112508565 isoform X2 [Cynara cardunculus var. scolymus]
MSPPPISTLIPSPNPIILTALFPPKAPKPSPPSDSNHYQPPPQSSSLLNLIPTTRREAATGVILTSIASLIPSFSQPPLATAFSFGISGPKDWLREQKKKASKYLLAPIDASRNSLQAAYLLITGSGTSPEKDLEEVQRLLASAARDCIPQERNSIVTFQSKTGVEVCTFRLVLKNAASLLDDKDPTLLEAEAKLSDLERSFSSLNSVANGTAPQILSNRQKQESFFHKIHMSSLAAFFCLSGNILPVL